MNEALLADAALVERSADPAQYVVTACERAKAWLANALEHGGIEQIVELKSQAEAIRIYSMQKQLGKDAELSAAEIVRRAERCIGIAVRRGQSEGTVQRQGERNDLSGHPEKVSVRQIRGHVDLHGNERSPGVYAMTDGVPAERFERAISEAKKEHNLSRANVVRKIRGDRSTETAATRRREIAELAASGHRSAQIAEKVGLAEETVRTVARRHEIEIPADRVTNKARKIDSNRIVREIVSGLETIETTAELIDFAQLDRGELDVWVESLNRSLRVVDRLRRRLKETRG